MLGAIAHRIAEQQPGDRNATVMAEALQQATDASYAAVGEPVEGTILTVARAAVGRGDGARRRPRRAAPATCSPCAAEAAREALERTPEQLKALRDAGVVDAGGRGLSVDPRRRRDGAHRPPAGPVRPGSATHHIPVPVPADDLTEDGPAYEVMYLLDADDDRIPELRRTLAPLGDSLVVVGGEGLFNVHVHVDDVGAAIEAGIQAGPPVPGPGHPLRRAGRRRAPAGRPTAAAARIVAVAAGPGLAALFAEAGAVVVEGAPGRRPSTGEVLEAITDCGAAGGRRAPQRPRLGPRRRDRGPDRRERRAA